MGDDGIEQLGRDAVGSEGREALEWCLGVGVGVGVGVTRSEAYISLAATARARSSDRRTSRPDCARTGAGGWAQMDASGWDALPCLRALALRRPLGRRLSMMLDVVNGGEAEVYCTGCINRQVAWKSRWTELSDLCEDQSTNQSRCGLSESRDSAWGSLESDSTSQANGELGRYLQRSYIPDAQSAPCDWPVFPLNRALKSSDF